MRVIFLDIDGVLNAAKYLQEVDTRDAEENLATPLHLRHMSGELVTKLESILLLTGPPFYPDDVRIVVSSSWRIIHTLNDIYDSMQYNVRRTYGRDLIFGLDIMIDKTPQHLGITDDRPRVLRGHEIDAWLADNLDVTQYVILDDDSDMLTSQRQNFVHTTWRDGLTPDHAMKAVRILNG